MAGSLEERARVWASLQLPYRASLVYEVRGAALVPETLAARPPEMPPVVPPISEG